MIRIHVRMSFKCESKSIFKRKTIFKLKIFRVYYNTILWISRLLFMILGIINLLIY